MEFRGIKAQYEQNKEKIDSAIMSVIQSGCYIGGEPVKILEKRLKEYTGVKHCITCANGTDALELALLAWGIDTGDVVFVPDFTFFASGEVVSRVGATPVFVDIDAETYNICPASLEDAINSVRNNTELTPKVVITVDLFGQPAQYPEIRKIANEYDLYILEDGAQGFGGAIGKDKACSFGDISTTSFFPAKPLGCYGDGGAIFTDNDDWAELISSLKVHGKGKNKYDNVRVGMNSRLDTLQAAILDVKLTSFIKYELEDVNAVSREYSKLLQSIVKTPYVKEGYTSSWAQYAIALDDNELRDGLKSHLEAQGIPSMIYYPKPMHLQGAFQPYEFEISCNNAEKVCDCILELPIHPYLSEEDIERVANSVIEYLRGRQ